MRKDGIWQEGDLFVLEMSPGPGGESAHYLVFRFVKDADGKLVGDQPGLGQDTNRGVALGIAESNRTGDQRIWLTKQGSSDYESYDPAPER